MSRLAKFVVASAVMMVVAAGCSKQNAQLTAPRTSDLLARTAPVDRALVDRARDRYIVVFRDDAGDPGLVTDELELRHGFKADYRYAHALRGFASKLSPGQLQKLQSDSRVSYIQPDHITRLMTTQPNPPSWGLDRVDQRSLPLNASYSYTPTGVGVDAYVIDTGIHFSHTDFGGRAVPGVDETLNGSSDDFHGHGTHVSGTLGGTSYGVAKAVHLISVRVLDATGHGLESWAVAGIDWVTANHTTNPAVANLSIGYVDINNNPVHSQATDDAIQNLINDGVTCCVAAGNSGQNVGIGSPGDVAAAITVGATDITDHFASFSNFGSLIDVSAPGVSIVSDWYTSNTATNTLDGTSMATPHVSGVAALYLQTKPTSTPAQVRNALVEMASPNKIITPPAGTANQLVYNVQPSVVITIDHINHVGDKDIFFLKATYTGAQTNDTFTWGNAPQTSPVNANPNTATRTILNWTSVTVTVTVTNALGITSNASLLLEGSHAP